MGIAFLEPLSGIILHPTRELCKRREALYAIRSKHLTFLFKLGYGLRNVQLDLSEYIIQDNRDNQDNGI